VYGLTDTEWLQLHLREICTRIRIRIKLKLQEEERTGDGFTHLDENKSSELPPCPSLVLRSKKNELSSKQQQGNTKESQQGIKDGLTFPHVVLLLSEEKV
jgi:hypothetical protein